MPYTVVPECSRVVVWWCRVLLGGLPRDVGFGAGFYRGW